MSWFQADEGSDQHKAYLLFKRIEENVNKGVSYLANAMTWVMNEVGTYKCSLGVQDLKKSIWRQTTLAVVYMMLSYLGISLIEIFMRSSDSIWVLAVLATA